MSLPVVIQGGMGMGVSNWRLARAVSLCGQMGIVSGTAMDTILLRRLQDGDVDGRMRRALGAFPERRIARRIIAEYFIPGGKSPRTPYPFLELLSVPPSLRSMEMLVAASFVEVYLAKEGHSGVVGINLLEKIRLPNLPLLYGAMLAGVDAVFMGAGIPREIPAALDRLSQHKAAHISIPIENTPESRVELTFDPALLITDRSREIKRPLFIPIIASTALALTLARKTPGINGFVVEGPLAGGHNAPPRGPLTLDSRGEPVYGPRDEVDLDVLRGLNLPFWLAGSFADMDRLRYAQARGAQGVQIGTAFAFCEESGMSPSIKRQVLQQARRGNVVVSTDPRASPTGFPFKVIQLEGTVSSSDVYAARPRQCNLGYLRTPYQSPSGALGYRCPAEDPDVFVQKGGVRSETDGRKCLCNGLLSVIGMPQRYRSGYVEPPILTSGDDVRRLARFLKPGSETYHASDVVNYVLGKNTQIAVGLGT